MWHYLKYAHYKSSSAQFNCLDVMRYVFFSQLPLSAHSFLQSAHRRGQADTAAAAAAITTSAWRGTNVQRQLFKNPFSLSLSMPPIPSCGHQLRGPNLAFRREDSARELTFQASPHACSIGLTCALQRGLKVTVRASNCIKTLVLVLFVTSCILKKKCSIMLT